MPTLADHRATYRAHRRAALMTSSYATARHFDSEVRHYVRQEVAEGATDITPALWAFYAGYVRDLAEDVDFTDEAEAEGWSLYSDLAHSLA